MSLEERGVEELEGRQRVRGEVREMEKWMKSERKPRKESVIYKR